MRPAMSSPGVSFTGMNPFPPRAWPREHALGPSAWLAVFSRGLKVPPSPCSGLPLAVFLPTFVSVLSSLPFIKTPREQRPLHRPPTQVQWPFLSHSTLPSVSHDLLASYFLPCFLLAHLLTRCKHLPCCFVLTLSFVLFLSLGHFLAICLLPLLFLIP